MAKKTVTYAATKSAKEKISKGLHKKRCAKGCDCGVKPQKKETGYFSKPEDVIK